jgi:hypothetical protein
MHDERYRMQDNELIYGEKDTEIPRFVCMAGIT